MTTTATSSGSVYIFVNNDNGTWSQQAKLTADVGAANFDRFGLQRLAWMATMRWWVPLGQRRLRQ